MFRIFLLFVFAFGFSLFVPTIRAGLINIGNVFGAGCCALLFFICLFFTPIKHIFDISPPFVKVIIRIIITLFFVGVLVASVISGFMLYYAGRNVENPTTAVVLGCKLNGTAPSLMLRGRLNAAYDYLTENPDVKCIVSGGRGSNEDISEAEAMKIYLVDKGISADRIIEETCSADTYENLLFSLKIMNENGNGNEAVIITEGFHQFRANIIAKKLGYDSSSYSADTPLWLLPSYWVREWFGVVAETFKGSY